MVSCVCQQSTPLSPSPICSISYHHGFTLLFTFIVIRSCDSFGFMSLTAVFELNVESNPKLLWFCYTVLSDWSKNSRHLLNQSDENWNQSQRQFGHVGFPALSAGHVHLLWNLIGLLCCVRCSDWTLWLFGLSFVAQLVSSIYGIFIFRFNAS